ACRSALGNDQAVALGLREQIEERQHVVVLVEFVARQVAANDLGEDVLGIVGTVQAHADGLRAGWMKTRTIPPGSLTGNRAGSPESMTTSSRIDFLHIRHRVLITPSTAPFDLEPT